MVHGDTVLHSHTLWLDVNAPTTRGTKMAPSVPKDDVMATNVLA